MRADNDTRVLANPQLRAVDGETAQAEFGERVPVPITTFSPIAAGGVMPVARIDGKAVGDGRPGPLTRRLREAYWAAHEDPKYTTPVDYQDADAD